ncbi:MAG: metallophosphoesterase [Lentisphaeria bacterium]|nr:metallophosphoesterase [Lentisphaeria bacterium]
MRIVHISDVHVTRLPRSPGALLDKRLFGVLNWVLRRAWHCRREYLNRAFAEIGRLAPELVLCTGDVTTVGSAEEHRLARSLLEPLRLAYGNRFLYVPGNHDDYVRDAACRTAFEETFRGLNSNRWQIADLPLEIALGGVRFLLLNEARPMPVALSSGRLGAGTLEWLAEHLRDSDPASPCVLVGHFPLRQADGRPLPRRRRLEQSEALYEYLRSGRVRLSLCGHVHHPFVRWEAGGGAEVCAGSLTLSGCFSVVDWLPEECRFRQFFVDVRRRDAAGWPPVEADLAPVS